MAIISLSVRLSLNNFFIYFSLEHSFFFEQELGGLLQVELIFSDHILYNLTTPRQTSEMQLKD
jgi:hypothetical protein